MVRTGGKVGRLLWRERQVRWRYGCTLGMYVLELSGKFVRCERFAFWLLFLFG